MRPETVGSVLHGAYGDYYEQLLCLRSYKRTHPRVRLALFFASEHRLNELRVFDLSFADEVHTAARLEHVAVDRFLQYQVRDPELQADVLAGLPYALRTRIDTGINLKPWTHLRSLTRAELAGGLTLSQEGRDRLPRCVRDNGLDDGYFDGRFTVGFLWRYRAAGGAISHRWQADEEEVRRHKSELLSGLIERHDAHVLVCGMNVRRDAENYRRIEAKYTEQALDIDSDRCIYMKGLSWGLELEILSRCTLCVVMPSGFSEALWMKRDGPTVLTDAPPHYVAKAVWNRMPLFGLDRPGEVVFQLRQPHTARRVLHRLESGGLLPARPDVPSGVGPRLHRGAAAR